MNSVAGDALENRRRSLLREANAELQRLQRQSHGYLQECQQDVQRHLSEVQNEVQRQQVASREEVENWDLSWVSLLLRDELTWICSQKPDQVRKFIRNSAVATWAGFFECSLPQLGNWNAVNSFEAQVAQIPWLRWMLDEPRIYRSYKVCMGLKNSLINCKLAATIFGVILSPHVYARWSISFARWKNTLLQVVEEWVQMSPPQLKSLCRVRLQQRVTACLSISAVLTELRVLEIPRQPQEVPMVEEQERGRETQLPRKRKPNNLSKDCRIWRMNFRSEVSSCASRLREAIIWVDEIESANIGAELQTTFEFLDTKKASGLEKIIDGDF